MRKMELKVFSGMTTSRPQTRAIVAVSSQRAAVEALQGVGMNVSLRRVATHWNITHNVHECNVALSKPGTVFAAVSANGPGAKHFEPMPILSTPLPPEPKVPKIPTDPDEYKVYTKNRRIGSDKNKLERGERRVTTWLPKEAVDALDKLTGGSTERGAVQNALANALIACAAQQSQGKRKAA